MKVEENIIKALEKITYGLYVLTTKKEEEVNGMIASWVSQVSFAPPLVVVGVRKNRYSHKIIMESSIFALNVLGKEDGGLVGKFKAPTPEEKFQGIKWETKMTGAPIIKETLAYMDCKLIHSVDTGDHTLFIGEIVDAGSMKDGIPMTSHDYGKVYLGQT
ncbi:MAG: flavin reductase family protein [Thermodesulfobacteriota bacterium]|nr:flavin reductase family protein [Thermodesulfobacteriota bacterium]